MKIFSQLVSSVKYLEAQGLSQTQLSSMHHFSLKGNETSFRATYKYFSAEKKRPPRINNTLFANRVIYVAEEYRLKKGSFSHLIGEALIKWPVRNLSTRQAASIYQKQVELPADRPHTYSVPDATTKSGIYIVTLNNSEPISVVADDPRHALTAKKVTKLNCKFGRAKNLTNRAGNYFKTFGEHNVNFIPVALVEDFEAAEKAVLSKLTNYRLMGTKGRRLEWLKNIGEARLREIIFQVLDENNISYIEMSRE